MSGLWFRRAYIVVPACWTVFTADGWTLTRVRQGWRCTRLGQPPYTVRTER